MKIRIVLKIYTLTHLVLGSSFDKNVDYLPKKLTHLTFGYNFFGNINCLPESIIHLSLPITHSPFFTKLPSKLRYLKFSNNFNSEVGHANCANKKCPRNLPDTLTHLIFGSMFNQQVDNLPKNLIMLTFGRNFNENVDKLPNTITHLTFGEYFNKKIDKLPNSITHLTFGESFDKNVEILPKSITHLTFGKKFNQKIIKLPDTIVDLEIYQICIGHSNCRDNSCPKNLPNSLINLKTNIKKLDNLSSSVKKLTITGTNTVCNLDLLPDTLTHLILDYHVSQFGKLPSELTYLRFNDAYNGGFNSRVGHSGCNNKDCPKNLPQKLTHLFFGNCFNECVDYLSETLTHLTFGNRFNRKVNP